MGKNVVKQHLLIFILGSAIVGIAGAMLVTQDGLFTPGSYRPMRYTFLIWVMVIVGGSGNNFGAPKLFPLPPTITITQIKKVYLIGL